MAFALAVMVVGSAFPGATHARAGSEDTSRAGVIAIASGPVAVRRGAPAAFDASFSSSTFPIVGYRWDFSPGVNCPSGMVLSNSTKTTADPLLVFNALCNLTVTLTVTDDHGNSDSDETFVEVFPRVTEQWSPTTVDLVTPGPAGDQRTPRQGFDLADDFLVRGATVSRCRPDDLPRWLCPRSDVAGSLAGSAYEVLDVADPGGPFDGYWFVVANHVTVRLYTLFNPDLFSTSTNKHRDPFHQGRRANWFRVNRMAKRPVRAMVAAVRAHENWGKGGTSENPNDSGHAGALACYLGASRHVHNPAVVLEAMFSPRRLELTTSADVELRRISVEMRDASADPLPVIWRGKLLYWNSGTRRWQLIRDRVGADPGAPIGCS